MVIDWSTVKAVTIPEGECKRVEIDGVVVWEKDEYYVYTFVDRNPLCYQLDVTEGQTLHLEWDCPNGSANGWVLNGNGCCRNITKLNLPWVGYTGSADVTITASGTVIVGNYSSSSANYCVKNGTIKIKIGG